MKILIVGVGSIGKRHLGILMDMGMKDIVVCDNKKMRLEEVQNVYPGLRGSEDYVETIKEGFNVVFICTPPHLHTDIMAKAVDKGCHVFCEKPLAMELKGFDEIERKAGEKDLVIMVGYVYRFCKPIQKIKEILDSKILGKIYSARTIISLYLPDWHPWEDYRQGVSARVESGGGVVLDLIHELDYVSWLVGPVSQIACFADRVSSLEIETEDME